MGHYDDEFEDSQPRRLVYMARHHMQAARNQYLSEMVQGGVSPQTKRQLATAAIQFYDVLWEHREERIVAEKWEELAVDQLKDALGSTVTVEQSVPGDTTNTRTVQRPAITQIDGQRIFEESKKLDQLAKELGFSAKIREQEAGLDEAVV